MAFWFVMLSSLSSVTAYVRGVQTMIQMLCVWLPWLCHAFHSHICEFYIYIYTVMHRITMFWSTTDRIYDGGPIRFEYYNTYHCFSFYFFTNLIHLVLKKTQCIKLVKK